MIYKLAIFLFMILCHIIEDFHLQGLLINLKQKSFWNDELSKLYKEQKIKYTDITKYQNDYKIALIIHSIENSIFVSLPILIDSIISYCCQKQSNSYMTICIISFICINTIGHYIIDNLKANKLRISLVTDQILHFCFICIYYGLCYNYLGTWI